MTATRALAFGLSICGAAITACSAPEPSAPSSSAWIAHLDAAGQLQWAADADRCWSPGVALLAPRPDGGWVGVGDLADGRDALALLDVDGSLVARHELGSDERVSALAGIEGGALLAVAAPGASPRLTRVAMDGGAAWHHEIQSEGVRIASIAELSDGGILAIGATVDAGGDHDPWVLRLDAHGELLWETTVPGDEDVGLLSGRQVGDGIVLAGRRRASGGETARVVRLDLDGVVAAEALDIGELGGAHLVTVEVAAPHGDVAILANQDFESLSFERWATSSPQPAQVVRVEWPDPWLVGTQMHAGPSGDIAVTSPILGESGDGTWIRRIDAAGHLTVDARLPDVGYGRALAFGSSGVLIGGSTDQPHGEQRCIRAP
jgi:hypothetical protein